MDFDRYGIEEWNNTRPQQLAHGYSNAVADTTLLRALVKKLVGWRKRQRQADPGSECPQQIKCDQWHEDPPHPNVGH